MAGRVAFIRPADGDRSRMCDDNLIAACGEGDRAALGVLFRKYHLDVYRFIARLTGSGNDELDDLVQDTFVAIQEGSKRFAVKSSVKSWIFGIAVNVVRNTIRADSRRKKAIDSYGQVPGGSIDTPLVIAEHKERLERMQSALNTLTHEHRVVFVMCVLEDIPGVEAARILGLRPGTLWRRLHEARKSLSYEMERRYV
jgi:RNA polymerase sigma-70 factor (ECF subfamily)